MEEKNQEKISEVTILKVRILFSSFIHSFIDHAASLSSSMPSAQIRREIDNYFGNWHQKESKKGPNSALNTGKSRPLILSLILRCCVGAISSTVTRNNFRARKINAFFFVRPNYPHFHLLFSSHPLASLSVRPFTSFEPKASLAFLLDPPLNLSLINY